jgi:hypothetical protein
MRLLAIAEKAIDLTPKLSDRARAFATGQGFKPDATDAQSVALVGTRMSGLRPVVNHEDFAVERILLIAVASWVRPPPGHFAQLEAMCAIHNPGCAAGLLNLAYRVGRRGEVSGHGCMQTAFLVRRRARRDRRTTFARATTRARPPMSLRSLTGDPNPESSRVVPRERAPE